jgi:hypothetical protein
MNQSVQMTLRGEKTKPYTDRQRLRTLYEDDEHTPTEIATQFECDVTTVEKYLQAFGISDEDDSSLPGVSFYTGKDGYEHLYVDQHHIRFHRALVIAEDGLEALPSESVVHHCTGIPWDNRIDELRVFPNHRAHGRHHARPEVADDQVTLDIYSSPELRDDTQERQTSLLSFVETDRAESNA